MSVIWENPFDSYLLGYIIVQVNDNKTQNIDALKKETRDKMILINENVWRRVFINFLEKVNICCRNQDVYVYVSHLLNIVFQTYFLKYYNKIIPKMYIQFIVTL